MSPCVIAGWPYDAKIIAPLCSDDHRVVVGFDLFRHRLRPVSADALTPVADITIATPLLGAYSGPWTYIGLKSQPVTQFQLVLPPCILVAINPKSIQLYFLNLVEFDPWLTSAGSGPYVC